MKICLLAVVAILWKVKAQGMEKKNYLQEKKKKESYKIQEWTHLMSQKARLKLLFP